jgi:3-keto-5-aminohexanoate cleavage enzyme
MKESKTDRLIINFTPTGLIPTKAMTPHVPTSPQEIIQEVLESRKYGVSMVHLHARGRAGRPTHSKEVYAEIIRGIREVNGWGESALILCVSTSGRIWKDFRRRSECLELQGDGKPDMASLTLSSLNFNRQTSVNSPQMIQKLARKMQDTGIKPELEAFDIGMINYAKYLHKKGFIEPPFYFNLILGNIACAQANMLSLGLMINELPEDSIWAVGGVGDAQLKMNVNGMINGGGVRVGLEDNIWLTPGRQKLATNMDLLQRIQTIAQALDIQTATPQEVRALLHLGPAGR